MTDMPTTNVQRQVSKAGRRLFIQTLLDGLVWCWGAALLLAAGWFLVQPWLLGPTEDWLRWAVAGGIFATGTGLAAWLACRQAPSAVDAALELDVRFNLKERTTSALTLAPELKMTQAGQALVADADAHLAKVDVRQGFPLRLSWRASLVPICGLLLALVAVFYQPVFLPSDADAALAAKKVVNAKDIAEKVDNLKKSATQPWPKEEINEKLDEIEKLKEKLFNQPLDPTDKDKIRDRLQKMLPLEEKLKDRLDDLKAQRERNKALEDRLKEMGKDGKQQWAKDGPAKKLEDALNKGDLEKAQKEIQDLADKLKEDKLTNEERQALQKQLEDLQHRLENVADLKDLKDRLQKDLEAGQITKEQFDKLMARAREEALDLQELQELAKGLGECKECLGGGNAKDAAGKLAALAKGLKDLDPGDRELLLLQEEQQLLLAAKTAMQNGLGGGGPPGGERPIAEDAKTGSKAAKQSGKLDQKALFRISGEQKGGTFSKIPANQVGGAFRQAQQDAPEAIERQQVPSDAAEMLRGYYENLGGGTKK